MARQRPQRSLLRIFIPVAIGLGVMWYMQFQVAFAPDVKVDPLATPAGRSPSPVTTGAAATAQTSPTLGPTTTATPTR